MTREQIAQSWTDAETIADLELNEIRLTLKEGAPLLLHVLKEAMLKNNLPLHDLKTEVTNDYISMIVKNLTFELVRRMLAYDRSKLNEFASVQIKNLIYPHDHPHKEFIRAYLMRHREETGEELTEEGLELTRFEIK